MKPPFYEKILDLASLMTDKESEAMWNAHRELREICETHQGSQLDHPFHWETLGDFTPDNNIAISIYLKALGLAVSLSLVEYIASINFALAERFFELNDYASALKFVNDANFAAQQIEDPDIKRDISELMRRIATNKSN